MIVIMLCGVKRSNDRRYLLCPAYVSVSVLKKFLHVKFELSSKHRVRTFCLHLTLTVCDLTADS